jgi:ABC-2 type transport system ATP-binding protein
MFHDLESAPEAAMAVLEAADLTKRYGRCVALDGFSLAADAGEIVGLVGHNGAGKTTFVEIVTGLARPDSGRVLVGGIDAAARPRAVRGLLGVAPQQTAVYVTATVRDNLRLFGALAGLRRRALARAIGEVAEELQLADLLDRRAGVLSGGQLRRVQVASALIGAAPLLLLDEPTAGADPETRASLLAAVRARAAAGAAVIYTTHYLPELADLGATLAVVRSGRVIARGTQEALLGGLPGELRLRLAPPAGAGSAGAGRTGAERNFVGPAGAGSAGAELTGVGPGCAGLAGRGPTGLAVAALAGLDRLPDPVRGRARADGAELRITSTEPAADLAAVLAAGCMPAAVDVRRPGLDDLYRSLTEEEAGATACPAVSARCRS